MELRFKTISLKNYKSFGAVPVVFKLDDPGCWLIVGENLDSTSDGKTSNGVGKTSAFEAICYALYDKTPSNISRDNLINNINRKNLEVILTFVKDKVEYVIQRARKTSRGTFVKLQKDGHDITLDTMSRTNDLIQEIVGIPFELFVQIVSISAANTQPFFNLPLRSGNGPSQIGMIEELFNLKTLTEKADILKEQVKETRLRFENKQQRYELLAKERARHEQQVVSAKKRVEEWERNNARAIAEISEDLNKVAGVDLDEQQKLYQSAQAARQRQRGMIRERNGIEDDIDRDLKALKKREQELAHLENDRCPFCMQSLPDASKKIEEIRKTISEIKAKVIDLQAKVDQINKDESELSAEIALLESSLQYADIGELIQIKAEADTLQNELDRLKMAKNPHVESLEELMAMSFEEVDTTELNALSNRYEHQKFLLKLLTKKDSFVRKNLLNRNIPFLNARLAHNLKELGLPHRVEFTKELTANITQFGNELDFGNLSHGQQARVNLALSFAFRDVLQNMYGFINILVLDESLDVGLDNVGIYSAVGMIKRKTSAEKLSTFVISHKDEITTMFDKKLLIQMKGGFSQVADQ
jgi:DNA repair exonuclease SbcCD ATPase subunit